MMSTICDFRLSFSIES